MSERDKMISGEWYFPDTDELKNDRARAKTLCQKYNSLLPEQE